MENFDSLVDEYRDVYKRFAKIEGRIWNAESIALELTKQMGELAKLVMMKEGYYFPARAENPNYQANIETVGDELADIMGNIIRLADYYKIDLLDAYKKARQMERKSLDEMESN